MDPNGTSVLSFILCYFCACYIYIYISRFVFALRYMVIIVLRVHNKMIMSCLHPNINRMLNFYGIKIRQVIEYFSFLIGNRAYKWAFKEETIKHKMVCAYILWFVNLRINETQKMYIS